MNIFLIKVVALILLFFRPNFAWSTCTALSQPQMNSISRKFNHNPFQMLESLITIANGEYSEAKKNLSVELSFDLKMVYKQSLKHHQNSSLFKNPYMTKIKTNFFGLYNQLYKKPTQLLAIKNADLTALERKRLKKGSVLFTNLSSVNCSQEEKRLLGCMRGYYVLDAIISPELSCNEKGFKTRFYLTYSKKYGFKITDVELSGSRVVLQTFKYTDELKKRGYKKTAILARFQNLQNSSSSFKFPSKLKHSKSILAIIESNSNRVPTSL